MFNWFFDIFSSLAPNTSALSRISQTKNCTLHWRKGVHVLGPAKFPYLYWQCWHKLQNIAINTKNPESINWANLSARIVQNRFQWHYLNWLQCTSIMPQWHQASMCKVELIDSAILYSHVKFHFKASLCWQLFDLTAPSALILHLKKVVRANGKMTQKYAK